MRKVTLTAQFTTSVSREFLVDDDFTPYCVDLEGMFFSAEKTLTRKEINDAQADLQFDEVWLVRENDKEIYIN